MGISLERHAIDHRTASSGGHIEKLQVGFARWKKKENPKMLIIFVCFFFLNLFRERKLIKVVFSMFPFFFLPGSCEPGGEKKLYFHCFFYYTLSTGEGKGVIRNFH